MALPWDIINTLGPSWGWLVFFAWILWEIYSPIPNHETKFQQFHGDLTARLERHEIGQISLAEEVDGVRATKYRQIHGREQMTTTSFKDGNEDESHAN